MGFEISYREHNEDTLESYLNGIVKDTEKTEKEMLTEAGNRVKEYIVESLNKHRRALAVRYKGRPAMADDVKVSVRTDKYGEKYARVSGGKKTGTLWHLVNDGNLYSQPTHFMDEAMNKLDDNIDDIWEEAER
ncbi:MAG TPA: hypothetical protein DEB05_12655 [Firmicutes bacterium]|jgi:HK97 gp10 family phage protein|nr:hypothetical protein [Bacillota bacterium]HCM13150.1 hypothetical protein [Lachnospiraceae bacterium]